jgi:hypothetical protein
MLASSGSATEVSIVIKKGRVSVVMFARLSSPVRRCTTARRTIGSASASDSKIASSSAVANSFVRAFTTTASFLDLRSSTVRE